MEKINETILTICFSDDILKSKYERKDFSVMFFKRVNRTDMGMCMMMTMRMVLREKNAATLS